MWRLLEVTACSIFLQTLLAGCTNAPRALRLEISAAKQTISSQDSICLTANLVAEEGPVCLAKSHRFIAEVSRMGDNAKPMSTDEFVFHCGTGIVECLLLSPVLLPVTILDVGDSLGRYTVLQKGDQENHDLEIFIGQNEGKDFCSLWQPSKMGESRHAWPPGEYHVKVRLQNDVESAIGIFPPPLFWWPYSRPVEAQTSIVVAE